MFKKEQVKNKLKEILCHKEKIKNYLIKEVNENEANMFTKCYAINEFKADLHIGTYVNDELISTMSFENINNIWYLTNICSNSLFENNYVKIINYFKSNINKQLFFKCDNCWPLDLHLQKCFKKLNDIEPGVWTLNKNHQKLNYFENDKDIKNSTLDKIYDCGYVLLEMK